MWLVMVLIMEDHFILLESVPGAMVLEQYYLVLIKKLNAIDGYTCFILDVYNLEFCILFKNCPFMGERRTNTFQFYQKFIL